MRPHLTMFQEISYAHCGTVDLGSEGKKYAGFWDADTKQFCCSQCRATHYAKKHLTEFKKQYSEMPVLHGLSIYK
jgi:hypothetical protein